MLQKRLVKYLKQCFSTGLALGHNTVSVIGNMWLACIIWLLLPNYILMQEFQLCSWIGIQHQKLNIGIEDILTSWSTIYFAAWLYDQSLDSSTSKDRSCFGIYLFNKEFSVLNTSFFQLDMLLLHIIVRPRELKKWCLRFMICSCVFGAFIYFWSM